MPLDISQAEDAVLRGQARMAKFQREFTARWFAPLRRVLAASLLDSLPEDVRAQLNPDDLAALERQVQDGE